MDKDKNFEKQFREAFGQIHAEDELRAKTKSLLARQINKKKAHAFPIFRTAAAAACLLIAVTAGGAWLYLTPSAYISIDINPSLELGVNRFDRIVSIEAFNSDGQELAEQLDIRYMDYNEAMEELLSEQTVETYLSEGAVMAVTVAGSDEEKTDQILENVETCTAGHSNISCHAGDMAEMHEAHSEGLSFGKYRAYLELKSLDPSVTTDDIRDLSMREIRDLIDSYSGDDSSATDSSPENGQNPENGFRYGNGHHGDEGRNHDYGNGQHYGDGPGSGNGAGAGSGNSSGNGAGAKSGSGNSSGNGAGAKSGSGNGHGRHAGEE